MFNSNVLEVGVGLIFAFLAVSLLSSAVTEAVLVQPTLGGALFGISGR